MDYKTWEPIDNSAPKSFGVRLDAKGQNDGRNGGNGVLEEV